MARMLVKPWAPLHYLQRVTVRAQSGGGHCAGPRGARVCTSGTTTATALNPRLAAPSAPSPGAAAVTQPASPRRRLLSSGSASGCGAGAGAGAESRTTAAAARAIPGLVPTLASVVRGAVEGSEVTLTGWIRQVRKQKRVAFASLSDGSSGTPLQMVWGDPEQCPRDLANGAAVRVTGTVRASPRQDQQAIELHVDTTEVIGSCPGEVYPLATKRHSLEYLREKTHLRPRTATIGAAMRIRSSLTHHVHTYFAATAFFQVHTPILTTNDCEGAGETFGVTAPAYTTPRSRAASVEPPTAGAAAAAKTDDAAHFFGRPAHLTVSGQLHAEVMATALSRVYTFGPTFRAENSNTPRHLAEFYMLEAEVAFGGLDTAVGIAEACIQHCAEALLADESAVRDLELLWAHAEANGPTADVGAWTKAVDAPFARMTYTDAIGALADSAVEFRYPISWGIDLKHEHEQWLARALHGGPVVITDYPAAIKPFYMRRNDGDATVACFDLLVPGVGELVGGSAREERLDVLEAAIPAGAHDALDWYVDLRRYGTVPHAGFGMGFERLIQYFTGISNIRDVIPFPRHVGTCRL